MGVQGLLLCQLTDLLPLVPEVQLLQASRRGPSGGAQQLEMLAAPRLRQQVLAAVQGSPTRTAVLETTATHNSM